MQIKGDFSRVAEAMSRVVGQEVTSDAQRRLKEAGFNQFGEPLDNNSPDLTHKPF